MIADKRLEVNKMVYKKKAEKRIRIPENLKTPFSQMVSDEAYLRATDESKAIIGLVFDEVLPSPAFPRDRMLDVYSGLRASRTFCVRTSLARREPSPTAAISPLSSSVSS